MNFIISSILSFILIIGGIFSCVEYQYYKCSSIRPAYISKFDYIYDPSSNKCFGAEEYSKTIVSLKCNDSFFKEMKYQECLGHLRKR